MKVVSPVEWPCPACEGRRRQMQFVSEDYLWSDDDWAALDRQGWSYLGDADEGDESGADFVRDCPACTVDGRPTGRLPVFKRHPWSLARLGLGR